VGGIPRWWQLAPDGVVGLGVLLMLACVVVVESHGF
jgi:hypothetical protein